VSDGLGAPESPIRDALVVAALLVCTNGPVMYLAWHVLHGAPQWEDPAVRAVFAATAGACALAVVLDSQRVSGRRLRRPSRLGGASVVAFTAAIVASSLWSLDPSVTRARSVIYVGLAALAWIVADLEFARFRRAVTLMLAVVLAGSLLAVVLSDSIGRDPDGNWRGLFLHANEAAPFAALAVLLALPRLLGLGGFGAGGGRIGVAGVGLDAGGGHGRFGVAAVRGLVGGRILPASLVVMGLLLLERSGSRTASLALLSAVVCASALGLASVGCSRFGLRAVRIVLPGAVLAAVAATAAVIELWGSSMLASRRAVWDFAWGRIGERPILGHGWFTAWEVDGFVGAEDLLNPGSAQNSFLEVWLGAGLLALAPFAVIIATALYRSGRSLWREPTPETWTWFALVVFLVAVNLTLSFVLWFSYSWVLLMSAALRPTGTSQQGSGSASRRVGEQAGGRRMVPSIPMSPQGASASRRCAEALSAARSAVSLNSLAPSRGMAVPLRSWPHGDPSADEEAM